MVTKDEKGFILVQVDDIHSSPVAHGVRNGWVLVCRRGPVYVYADPRESQGIRNEEQQYEALARLTEAFGGQLVKPTPGMCFRDATKTPYSEYSTTGLARNGVLMQTHAGRSELVVQGAPPLGGVDLRLSWQYGRTWFNISHRSDALHLTPAVCAVIVVWAVTLDLGFSLPAVLTRYDLSAAERYLNDPQYEDDFQWSADAIMRSKLTITRLHQESIHE